MTITPAGPRLLLPGLVPREPGLETYGCAPAGSPRCASTAATS